MTKAREIIEGIITRPSVFKSKEKLYPEYIPPELPHREGQLKELALLFKPLLISPGSISQRVLLLGGLGTGKTVTARAFGLEFRSVAKSRGVNVEYIHVNCHRERTLHGVVSEIAKQLGLNISTRGLSAYEIYSVILHHLERKNLYTIITLDEFDYFIEIAGSDAVYFLVRTYDEYSSLSKRVNFIFIARSASALSRLDPATESYLMRNVIRFEPYSFNELYDILVSRSSEAFYEGVVDDEVLRYIADIEGVDRGGEGNARIALEVLLLAGEAADKEEAGKVTIEHVRKAYAVEGRYIAVINDLLIYAPLHELIILAATVKALRKLNEPYVRIGVVEQEYQQLCEELGEKPRRHTQIYEYVMDLKRRGIIEARTSGKGYRGKSTLIGISIAPLEALEKRIIELIEKRKGIRL